MSYQNPATSYILDEEIIRSEIARREMSEAEATLEKQEISWQLSLNNTQGYTQQHKGRRGGGGEPLRRSDGTIVANLRTFKRTANPNLPMSLEEDDAIDQGHHQVESPGKFSPAPVAEFDDDQRETPPRHVLFSHKYDSPEELESLAMRRRKQSELKEVLERQIAEKRERKAREKRMRELEEAKEFEEEKRLTHHAGLSPGIASLQERAKEPLDADELSFDFEAPSASPYSALKNSDGMDSLENLLDSPIHATVRSSSEDLGDDTEANEAYLTSHKEEREILLRTIKDQDKEMESLLSKLQGLKEGRQLFVDTMVPESSPGQVDRKSGMLYSPVKKRSTGGAGAALAPTAPAAPLPDFTTPELSSSSEYVPVGGSLSTFYQHSLSHQNQKNVISSNILQSSFGLTAFEKTYSQNQYETRKEEALESFLQAFTEGTWR